MDFLNYLETMSPSLCQATVLCVGFCLQQTARQFTILHQSLLLLVQSLQTARGESLGSSQIFPEHVYSPGTMHNPMYRHSLLDFEKYTLVLQNP